MRGVGFDYPITCPRIDKEIGHAQQAIEQFLDNFLEMACPLLDVQRRKALASDHASDLYHDISSLFEEVRSTNEDMRREADRQINNLKDEIADLEAQVRALEAA